MDILKRLVVKGFRSIREMDLELRPLNVLIGANGAGKSNLIAFFKMLNEMSTGRLQQYIGTSGRAHSLLYLGPKVTPELEATLEFETEQGTNSYSFGLTFAAGDRLAFARESVHLVPRIGESSWAHMFTLGAFESMLVERKNAGEELCVSLYQLLNQCRVYHFHDTSSTARVLQFVNIKDNRQLLPDAANLAAMLSRYREQNKIVYQRIVRAVRQIAPFFDDFDLEPTGPAGQEILLNWRQRDTDLLFGPHQLSDGTLRAICLVTLLLQPEQELPRLIIVDEPELGLHPYALSIVASLFQAASEHSQVLLSTQSAAFLNNFDAEDVVVVNREGRESQFVRPEAKALEAWFEDYSLGEVWEKNVIGGGPH